jgi:DNA-binding transcriptional regulator YiaG
MLRDRIGIDKRLLEIDETIMELFKERETLKATRISNHDIAKLAHVSESTVHHWAHGR